MNWFRVFLLSCLMGCVVLPVSGQNVGGGLSLAGVASQIDGDAWGGYNKLGWSFGGYAYYDFSDRLALMTEILYGHRGSREAAVNGQVSLDFIDVPVMLRLKGFGEGKQGLYGNIGTAFNILLNARSGIKPFILDQNDNFRRLTMDFQLGGSYFFNDYIGLFGRWSISYFNLSKFYPPWLSIHYISFGVKVGFK
ncbi:MAG: outer membrane beta-barrel protein [Bacteroidota bacterium]